MKFSPEKHISIATHVTHGPIVIDGDGSILSGHARHAELKHAYEQSPEDAAKYRMMLTNHAPSFGINPLDVMRKKQPVLVRKINHEDLPHL